MSKLPSYVKRIVFAFMLASVTGLWLLQLIFAYLSELESLTDSYHFLEALRFIGYRSADFLVLFMPTGVLLGAVIGLGLLAKSSELTIMRSAGISSYRIIAWTLQPTLFFVLLALVINEWILPTAQYHARQIKNPNASIVSIHGYRTLINDDATNKQHIIFIDEADTQGNLYNIKRFDLNDGWLDGVLMAPTGKYTGSYMGHQNHYGWQLNQVQAIRLGGNRQQTITQESLTSSIILPIAKDSIHLLTRTPTNMSISQLYQHDRLMRHQGTSSPQHHLAFWQKLLSPFAMLSLVVVACSFVFGSLRSQGLGLRVVMALLTGLLFSYVQDLSGYIALAVGLPAVLMVLWPIIASAGLGLWLIAKKR